jgi:hypothetical protein
MDYGSLLIGNSRVSYLSYIRASMIHNLIEAFYLSYIPASMIHDLIEAFYLRILRSCIQFLNTHVNPWFMLHIETERVQIYALSQSC